MLACPLMKVVLSLYQKPRNSAKQKKKQRKTRKLAAARGKKNEHLYLCHLGGADFLGNL